MYITYKIFKLFTSKNTLLGIIVISLNDKSLGNENV